jgi:hypothetical protein
MFLERMLQHTGGADSVLTYLRLLATAYGKTMQLVPSTRTRILHDTQSLLTGEAR